MAAYTYLGGISDIKTEGLDRAEAAERFTYRAVESGIVFTLLYAPWPSALWTPAVLDEEASLWSDRWNQNARVPGVTAIGVTQDTDELGQLKDVALVAIVSTSGKTVAQITVPEQEWNPSVAGTTLTVSFGDRVRTEVQRLDAIEAAGVATAAAPSPEPAP